ncbi:hypothetical protein [Nitrospirillum amazonense]|uniref:hypothetical protein n=1 Tax=Nitrospirillum amazonense TaxID=28077 RepID=UPI003BAEA18B
MEGAEMEGAEMEGAEMEGVPAADRAVEDWAWNMATLPKCSAHEGAEGRARARTTAKFEMPARATPIGPRTAELSFGRRVSI